MFADPLTERLAAFGRDIGLPVRPAALSAGTLLPGLDIRDRALVVDEARLAVADPAEGGSATIIENFNAGFYFGVSLLDFYAMSCEPRRGAQKGVAPYPHVLRWVR